MLLLAARRASGAACGAASSYSPRGSPQAVSSLCPGPSGTGSRSKQMPAHLATTQDRAGGVQPLLTLEDAARSCGCSLEKTAAPLMGCRMWSSSSETGKGLCLSGPPARHPPTTGGASPGIRSLVPAENLTLGEVATGAALLYQQGWCWAQSV